MRTKQGSEEWTPQKNAFHQRKAGARRATSCAPAGPAEPKAGTCTRTESPQVLLEAPVTDFPESGVRPAVGRCPKKAAGNLTNRRPSDGDTETRQTSPREAGALPASDTVEGKAKAVEQENGVRQGYSVSLRHAKVQDE